MKFTYTNFAGFISEMDYSELLSAKVQFALRPLGFQFSWKRDTHFLLRSKEDLWIASDQIEIYGKFTAVQ